MNKVFVSFRATISTWHEVVFLQWKSTETTVLESTIIKPDKKTNLNWYEFNYNLYKYQKHKINILNALYKKFCWLFLLTIPYTFYEYMNEKWQEEMHR